MSFLANRTRLLDHLDNDSLLFRGNVPEANGSFVLKDTLAAMEAQAKAANVPFDRAKPLYVFTLLSESHDKKEYNIEDHFFEQHPDIGKLLHDDVEAIALKALFHDGKDALGKAMLDIVKQVRSCLEANNAINVYIHCSAGLDRTGIISAGYGLLYQGFSPEQAKNQNIDLGLPRPPSTSALFSINAMIDVLG